MASKEKREDEKRMISKKQIFAAVALIAIALSTIAWAQMSLGTATGTVKNTIVTGIRPPDITIDKKDAGTAIQYGGLAIDVYFQYVEVKVALVDLGGLYESMDKFFVTFKNGDEVFAVLSLDEPTTTFIYDATGHSSSFTAQFDIVVSWKAGKKLPTSVSYGVAAEVIGVYGGALS